MMAALLVVHKEYRLLRCGHHVALVRTNVSAERIAYIIGAKRIGEL
jgi:hypothetical protein